jgi:hypothetical protein
VGELEGLPGRAITALRTARAPHSMVASQDCLTAPRIVLGVADSLPRCGAQGVATNWTSRAGTRRWGRAVKHDVERVGLARGGLLARARDREVCFSRLLDARAVLTVRPSRAAAGSRWRTHAVGSSLRVG